MDAFLEAQEEAAGGELSVSDEPGEADRAMRTELDVSCTSPNCMKSARSTPALADLAEMGFDIQSLIPQERTGSRSRVTSFAAATTRSPLEDLRGLLAAVRAAGEKGLQVTRFKGLGEMNAEELRETTLDPANRTLIQVTMQDAGAADEMFRVLMGDKVEPRREFIEKHALEVRNLDV